MDKTYSMDEIKDFEYIDTQRNRSGLMVAGALIFSTVVGLGLYFDKGVTRFNGKIADPQTGYSRDVEIREGKYTGACPGKMANTLYIKSNGGSYTLYDCDHGNKLDLTEGWTSHAVPEMLRYEDGIKKLELFGKDHDNFTDFEKKIWAGGAALYDPVRQQVAEKLRLPMSKR